MDGSEKNYSKGDRSEPERQMQHTLSDLNAVFESLEM